MTLAKIRLLDRCYLTGSGERGTENEYEDPESEKWE